MRLLVEQLSEFIRPVINSQTEEKFSEINTGFVIQSWTTLMERGSGVAYGAVSGKEPVGFLLGIHCEDLMTGLPKAFEYLFMVNPGKRFGGIALGLLKEFESGATEAGCVETILGGNAAYKPEALGRWYRSLGYVPLAISYRKRVALDLKT